MTEIKLESKAVFYTKAVKGKVKFGCAIYYCERHTPWVNAIEFFLSLGVPEAKVSTAIYQWLNKLGLKQNEDYVVRIGENPNDPQHILTLFSAYRIASETKSTHGQLAIEFFDAVLAQENVLKILVADLVIRQPLFSLESIADYMKTMGYNDNDFNVVHLKQLLQHDRILNKNLKPCKGYEPLFGLINNRIHCTPSGVVYMLRKYLGYLTNTAVAVMAELLPHANRLATDSMFNENRTSTGKQTQPKKENADGDDLGHC